MRAQKPLITLKFPMVFAFFPLRSFKGENERFKLLFFTFFTKMSRKFLRRKTAVFDTKLTKIYWLFDISSKLFDVLHKYSSIGLLNMTRAQ